MCAQWGSYITDVNSMVMIFAALSATVLEVVGHLLKQELGVIVRRRTIA